jgi:hypothetical protein
MKMYRIHAIAFGGASAVSGFLGVSVAGAALTTNIYRSVTASVTSYTQPIHTGNSTTAVDFTVDPTAHPISVYQDFVVPASSFDYKVSSQVCRQAWNGTTVACGTTGFAVYLANNSAVAHELTPTTSGVQATTNSIWDYYHVTVSAVNNSSGAPAVFNPGGVGIGGW